MHGALANLADKFLDVAHRDPARRQSTGTVNVRMRHGSARVELECQRLTHPAAAEVADQCRVVARRRRRKAVKQPVGPFEHRARPIETCPCQQRGAQTRLRRPASV